MFWLLQMASVLTIVSLMVFVESLLIYAFENRYISRCVWYFETSELQRWLFIFKNSEHTFSWRLDCCYSFKVKNGEYPKRVYGWEVAVSKVLPHEDRIAYHQKNLRWIFLKVLLYLCMMRILLIVLLRVLKLHKVFLRLIFQKWIRTSTMMFS